MNRVKKTHLFRRRKGLAQDAGVRQLTRVAIFAIFSAKSIGERR